MNSFSVENSPKEWIQSDALALNKALYDLWSHEGASEFLNSLAVVMEVHAYQFDYPEYEQIILESHSEME